MWLFAHVFHHSWVVDREENYGCQSNSLIVVVVKMLVKLKIDYNENTKKCFFDEQSTCMNLLDYRRHVSPI